MQLPAPATDPHAASLGLVAFLALLFMRERPLGQKSGIELARERSASSATA